jgi:hypothetical protein
MHPNQTPLWQYALNEAMAVLDAGRDLWRAYFTEIPPHGVRETYKLNRPDAGWYQIRNALKERGKADTAPPVDFSLFEAAYRSLTEKLIPQVYDLGFLRG